MGAVKVLPLLVYRPERCSPDLNFWLWGVAVELDNEFADDLSACYLIKRQRKLSESPRPMDGLTALILGSALSDHLKGLNDRQIGQLLFDFCWTEFHLNGPELIICSHAIDRLRSSKGGAITNEEAQEGLKQQPACPKCGNAMFLHYGIDEPDFWLCDCVGCRQSELKPYILEGE